MKNGEKNKSVAFIILFSVYIYVYNIYTQYTTYNMYTKTFSLDAINRCPALLKKKTFIQ